VIDAFFDGLERARSAGIDLAAIGSVASFFVSRVDTEIDKRLDKIGTNDANALKGKAAVANARLAYQLYEEKFGGERWASLAASGAKVQRPLWASTGVKDPAYDDTMYVVDLVAENTVNTMPEATLDAVADHGQIRGDTIRGSYADAQQVLDRLAAIDIDYDEVVELLEVEGVQKFEDAWATLLEGVQTKLDAAKG
jgi:transaldolase